MKLIYNLLSVVGVLLTFYVQAEESSFVQVDTSKLSEGLLVSVKASGQPVFILNRRLSEIDSLKESYTEVSDPVPRCPDCDPVLRSILPDYLVIWGFHPTSGCKLVYVSSTAKDWAGHAVHGKGGFVDKCSATEYDLTGRKLTGPDALPDELSIPLHCFHEGTLEINKNQTYRQKTKCTQEEQERSSLYWLIMFILALLVLNVWAQRGAVTDKSRLIRSIGAGIVVIITFNLIVYFIEGTYDKFIIIAVTMELLIAMVTGFLVWVGYVIFGSTQEEEDTNHTINGLYGGATSLGFFCSAGLAFSQWSWIPLLIFVVVCLIVWVTIKKFGPLTSKH